MKEKLTSQYGSCKTIDYLMDGSIWDESRDWMMGLIKKERKLAAIWESEQDSKLAHNLEIIGLYAVPVRTDQGYIAIEYTFDNSITCESELAAMEDDAL